MFVLWSCTVTAVSDIIDKELVYNTKEIYILTKPNVDSRRKDDVSSKGAW
jgi:hypothetical protein